MLIENPINMAVVLIPKEDWEERGTQIQMLFLRHHSADLMRCKSLSMQIHEQALGYFLKPSSSSLARASAVP